MVCSLCSPGSVTTNAPGRGSSCSSSARQRAPRRTALAPSASSLTGRPRRARRASSARHGAARRRRACRPRWPPSRTGRRARRAPRRRAAAPAAVARAGRRSTAAQSAGSWPSTSTPDTPSATAVRSPPTRGRDHRGAAGLGLERDQPERLAVRRDDGDVGRAVPVGELGLRRPAARSARRRRCRARRPASASDSGCARPLPRGPPTHGDDQPVAQRGVALEQLRRRRAAARRAPSAAGSGRRTAARAASAGRPSAAPGARPLAAGRKTSRSTPGATTTTRSRVGAVELDQLARLLVGVGDQPVGGLDDLLLADHPGRPARGCRRRPA